MKELIVKGAHKKDCGCWDRISQPKSPETSARWPSHGLLLSPQVKRSPMATQSINTGHLYMLNIPGFYNFLLHSSTTNTPNNFPLLTPRANVLDSFTIADSWWMVSIVGDTGYLNTGFLLHIGARTREYYPLGVDDIWETAVRWNKIFTEGNTQYKLSGWHCPGTVWEMGPVNM